MIALDWNSDNKQLSLECTNYGHVVALNLTTRGDMLIVGDMMKSVTCLFYDVATKRFTRFARDSNTRWMTSIESVSSDLMVGADIFDNLLALQKVPESETQELALRGQFNLGDKINKFQHGIVYIWPFHIGFS